ncbi:hypothetical protein IE53DRAFT_369875 [Violaceomyces palustris]|uniref:Uncharacterized protein n=1 Tax=Violaceomyces palustris TaxID=1673888 RepID=A0ACD0NU40_9BASI|nr:hypothetical protein IE53DRAFT_369875 [Violaceomyces palustris]
MSGSVIQPGAVNGNVLAILLCINFHCKVNLPGSASEVQRELLLFVTRAIAQTDRAASSLSNFLEKLKTALKHDPQAGVICNYLKQTLRLLDYPDGLVQIFSDRLGRLICPHYDDPLSTSTTERFIERRSYFGLYFRRVRYTFENLSLTERHQIGQEAVRWRDTAERDSPVSPEASEDENPRVHAYDKFQEGLFRGDYTAAKSNMHKFFDYSSPGSFPELHQHTLLNLASFHYQTGSLSAAKVSLNEAIRLATTVDDHECISMCASLMQRLQAEATSGSSGPRKTSDSVDQTITGGTSIDKVWRAQNETKSGAPLPQVLRRLLESLKTTGGKECPSAVETSVTIMQEARDNSGRTAVEPSMLISDLWEKMGFHEVADAHATIAEEAASKEGVDASQIRLSLSCSRSRRLAGQGLYDQALAQLLRKETYETLSFREYSEWREAIWEVLWLKAKRREETVTLQKLGELDPGSKFSISDQQASTQLESEKRGSRSAEREIEELLAKGEDLIHALAAMEEIMPSILVDQNLERRSKAFWTYARCILAQDGTKNDDAPDETVVREAIAWLVRADLDMSSISLLGLHRRVLYYLARLLHHLGELEQRDEISIKHGQVDSAYVEAKEGRCEESVRTLAKVAEVVGRVGAYVGGGGSWKAKQQKDLEYANRVLSV